MMQPISFSRRDTTKPFSLVLLCSDDPQHGYLRYLLHAAFPQHTCILEPNEGQIRHLERKGRKRDLRYMRYHAWRRRRMGHSRRRKAYFSALIPEGAQLQQPALSVDSINCTEVWELLEKLQPDMTLVCGTKYIGQKAIARGGLLLNLHAGYLPDYKGNHCIFFAMLNGDFDKLGATIHQLTGELDGGHILERIPTKWAQGEDEEDIYARSIRSAIEKVIPLIQKYAQGESLEFWPQAAKGSIFRHRDRGIWKEIKLWRRLKEKMKERKRKLRAD